MPCSLAALFQDKLAALMQGNPSSLPAHTLSEEACKRQHGNWAVQRCSWRYAVCCNLHHPSQPGSLGESHTFCSGERLSDKRFLWATRSDRTYCAIAIADPHCHLTSAPHDSCPEAGSHMLLKDLSIVFSWIKLLFELKGGAQCIICWHL